MTKIEDDGRGGRKQKLCSRKVLLLLVVSAIIFLAFGNISTVRGLNLTVDDDSITKQTHDPLNLPNFMDSYVTFHRSNVIEGPNGLTVKNNTKYLVWRCKQGECGGFGDRVNGMVFALYMAMCTKRVLLIEANDPYPFENYLNPNLIQWNAKTQIPVSFALNMFCVPNSTLHSHPQLDEKLMGISLRSNLWLPWHVETGVCMNNFWSQSSSNPNQHESLWYNLFHMLFKFSSDVNIRSDEQKLMAGLSTQKDGLSTTIDPYIAVHVRTGDVGFETSSRFGSMRPHERHGESNETLQQFLECSYKVQMGLEKCMNFTPQIFVASDSKRVKDRLHEADPDNVKIYNDISIFHVDKTAMNSLANPKDAYIDLWGEIRTLVDAHCLITSRSGFSEIAERARKHPPCAVRFDICGDENVRRALKGVNCNI